MTDRRDTNGGEGESLAAEYSLGLLDGAELRTADERAANDPGFRAEVERWTGRLSPLLDEVEPVAPPERLWRGIESRLGPGRASAQVHRLRHKIGIWRTISAGSMALAAALALFLVVQPRRIAPPQPAPAPTRAPTPTPAPLVAMLGAGTGPVKMMATWDSGNRRLVVEAAAPAPLPGNRSHELWIIPAGGTPRSLGVMPDQTTARMTLDPAKAVELREGASLAVSEEPSGGSPIGSPTGPVIASGKLERA